MNYSLFEEKMKKLGISKKDFSKFIDVNYSTLHHWKRKEYVPKYAEIALQFIENAKSDMNLLKEVKTICK